MTWDLFLQTVNVYVNRSLPKYRNEFSFPKKRIYVNQQLAIPMETHNCFTTNHIEFDLLLEFLHNVWLNFARPE